MEVGSEEPAPVTRYLSWHKIFKNRPASRDFFNKSNHSNESNKSYTLRCALVCDGTNTPTDPAAVVVRVVVAAKEVQVTSTVEVRQTERTERTRPVVAVLTHEVSIGTEAPASSWEEDTIAIDFTGYEITVVSTLGCPCPLAFCTEFFKLSNRWHAPHTAPVGSGGIILCIA